MGGGYDTLLMARNVCQSASGARAGEGRLTVYGANGESCSRPFRIASESACNVRLSELLPDDGEDAPRILWWYLNTSSPDVETYWVSYTADGSICGDHGF